MSAGPVLLTLAAAAVWALSGVLARLISRREGTLSQMIASNGLFVLACAALLPNLWPTPDLAALALMVALGLVGGLAQVLMYEGYRWAPASLVAPTEYTAFVWAFLLGFAIWGDVPTASVWGGAALIAGAGLVLLWTERARLARPPTAPEEAFL